MNRRQQMILIIDVPTVLTGGAAIAEGSSEIDRESVEQELADLESRGFLLRTPVTQICRANAMRQR